MMAANIRRLGVYLVVGFAIVSLGLGYWAVIDAPTLAARADNPEVITARRSAPRGTIFDASGGVIASTTVTDGLAVRTYTDPAFSHVVGYASLRYGTTGLEEAYDDILSGLSDPNPVSEMIDHLLDRPMVPSDLQLTIDRRLQDFAAQQLGSSVGAIVALDPRTGAILASVSTPTYDATPLAGDSAASEGALDAISEQPNNPLVDRTRQGRYTPGSIMKVFTAAAALDSGVITPDTTYEDQPRQETEGFVVDGFTITEHDLGVPPALWNLSPAMQVSSNIYFAHVGLDLGPERFGEYAERFGFCSGFTIGQGDRALAVAPSYVTVSSPDGGCSPFKGDVDLASAAFGQAEVVVTPMQMARMAATIANGGIMPEPYVVASVRSHSETGAPSDIVLDRATPRSGSRVVGETTAGQVRSVMVDAVEGELGRLYAGNGAVTLYGASGSTAGKTGTAQRAEGEPHSWFIGFAPAQGGATPAIAVAVLLEGGGAGSVGAAPIGGAVMAQWLTLRAAR
jgi:peptidoglycan glycosyltransferase